MARERFCMPSASDKARSRAAQAKGFPRGDIVRLLTRRFYMVYDQLHGRR
jgi:hypothetical protein